MTLASRSLALIGGPLLDCGWEMEFVRRPSGPEGRVKFDVVDRGGLTRDDAETEAGKLVFEAAEGLPNRNVAQPFGETLRDPHGYQEYRWVGFSVPTDIADRVEAVLIEKGHKMLLDASIPRFPDPGDNVESFDHVH
jgi:hypothetical protein